MYLFITYCSKCGKQVSDEAIYCQYCGNRLSEEKRY
ncbi:MAG: zinc ribbon domain-containing protein [Lachnospiraceae bacterium]|nr:zinc ribbon domain-containing protein [Lachnospiraceae bacterium]